MEAAISIAFLGIFGWTAWHYRYLPKLILINKLNIQSLAETELAIIESLNELKEAVEQTGNILLESEQAKALQTVIPKEPRQPIRSRKYTGIAARRAAAEQASMGPQNHSQQVIANNTKAMEA